MRKTNEPLIIILEGPSSGLLEALARLRERVPDVLVVESPRPPQPDMDELVAAIAKESNQVQQHIPDAAQREVSVRRQYQVLVGNSWIRVKGRELWCEGMRGQGSLAWTGKNGIGGVAKPGMWK